MLRCLLVDDNPRFSRAARRLLEQEGVDVVGQASTSAEGLRLIRHSRPDVALVDLEIGEECGFDLARRIDELAEVERPEVIMMSARRPEDYEELLAQSSVLGFIAKQDLSAAALGDLWRRCPRVRRPPEPR